MVVFFRVCFSCKRCLNNEEEVKMFANENDMDPGDVPPALQGLTEVEKMLTAPAHATMCAY